MSIQPGYKATMESRPKLLDQVRNKIRLKHYSIRTEQTYVDWIKRFVRFHGLRHPATRVRDILGEDLSKIAAILPQSSAGPEG